MQKIPARAGRGSLTERGTMLLLRHASAGERLSSPGVDRFRRLDEGGRIAARQLAWSLADREITQIVSSPFPRCVETVAPISAARGLAVETHWELEPEVELGDLMTLLVDLPETTLVCTHREVFEKLLGWDTPCEKGAVWVVERNGRELVPTLYLEPPVVVPSGQRQAV